MNRNFDIIVIGGGHAGTEAAWAAAAALGPGGRIALITMDPAAIGRMSCNPAIGGLGKGQIVREIDALGGLMGRAIDATGIMFKMLNTSKGPAVRGPRAQADKYAYAAEIQRLLTDRPSIEIWAGTALRMEVVDGAVTGVVLAPGAGAVSIDRRALESNADPAVMPQPVFHSQPQVSELEPSVLHARAVVLTTGTFLRALMHTGDTQTEGGRVDEGTAASMSNALRELGFDLGRLKTGTPPRLDRTTIDWDSLDRQCGDDEPVPFSDQTPAVLPGARFPRLVQTECRLTATTAEAHRIIRDNLHRAPMYSGQVEAETGPRYCPSIEDKVVRFADRDSHHVFLEPESLFTDEIYCNGISTSLPKEVQAEVVRRMPGCADARILRWGYAVEYDMVWPHQIDATGETKRVRGLFFAGQINCTTGYEEAGAQGVIAGLNAARLIRGDTPVRFGRDVGYLGVMMDDLVTRTPREPYRMFTSRAEHRLHLRADNADERLTPLGIEYGLIESAHQSSFERSRDERLRIAARLEQRVEGGRTVREFARQPQTDVASFRRALGAEVKDVTDRNVERVLIECRYEGYLRRQRAEIRRLRDGENRVIPEWLDPHTITGLRTEAAEALARFSPRTMGQAGRLAGINPADLSILAVAIRKRDAGA